MLKTFKITLNIESDLHNFIKSLQSEIKKREPKSVSLEKIILQFVQKGIEFEKKMQITQNYDEKNQFQSDKNAEINEKSSFIDENSKTKTVNTQFSDKFTLNFDMNKANLYKNKEYNELKKFELELKQREFEIRETEKEINEAQTKLFENQWQILKLKEELIENINENAISKTLFDLKTQKNLTLQNEISNLKNQINSQNNAHSIETTNLIEIISDFKNNFVKLEKSNKQFIDELSANKNTVWNFVERFLPVGLTFLMLQKNNKLKAEFDDYI